ncbi:MAG: aminotransferase class I/II-fold pyridoxal phosphate-dependent enzyme [Desulfobacter sp.]|nr:aminotransferase class I/II-fold pyridoxal phosphate-dependent enzyme [Desulfobacter sp.]
MLNALKKDWLVFSPGIVPAINYLIQSFCYPGDRVIIQNPVYYPFFNAISNNGCHPVYNQLKFQDEQYTMDFDDLEEKVKGAHSHFPGYTAGTGLCMFAICFRQFQRPAL